MKQFDVDKYFRKNPPVPFPVPGKFPVAVIIPAYDETDGIAPTLHTLHTAIQNAPCPVAAVVVVNHPPGADAAPSEKLFLDITSGTYPGISAIYLPDNPGGVGLARKTGMDAFLASLAPEELESAVIFSLDADTIVDANYITTVLPEVLKGGAVAIPFSHREAETPEIQQAIGCYEAYMSRYVQKLSEAGSPYAFFTIGSAFAVRGDACIRAGGMKVRQAGEDFYFLQAVAKSSGVRQLTGVPLVHPSPRPSGRVPFGTGPAVASLLAGEVLHPISDAAFGELKLLLDQSKQDQWLCHEHPDGSVLPECARDFLQKEGFFDIWNRMFCNLPDSPSKRQKAFNEWFDGLKTLKFLHFFDDLHKFDIDKKVFKC